MNTRRSFLRSLVLSSAALYLRVAPNAAAAIPTGVRLNPAWEDAEYEVQFVMQRGSFERLAPVAWDGRREFPLHPTPTTLRFTVKDGIVIYGAP